MKKLFGMALVAFFVLPASGAMAAASQFVVDTTADENPDIGTTCSLRDATVSSTSGPIPGCTAIPIAGNVNKITFSPTLGANPVVNLNPLNGQLFVQTNDVDIIGPATVAGAPASGFRVLASVGIGTELTGITITGGSENSVGSGGGINLNGGSLTLTNSVVTGNKTTRNAAGATTDGGGIFANGQLFLNNSIVSNNQSVATDASAGATGPTARGGGITANGSITMSNSQVSGNSAIATSNSTGGTEASGGGIRSGDNVAIDHSTIAGNAATASNSSSGAQFAQGGGLLAVGATTLNVELSTIANNRLKTAGTGASTTPGGGIFSADDTSDDKYISSTLSGNGLDPASNIGSAVGMNFRSVSLSTGSRTFSNTIIANPVGSVGTNCDGSTPYTITGPNVDFPQDGVQPCFQPGASIMNTDPLLGPLASNGGPTPTMAPGPTSPVIDQGKSTDQTVDPTHDQRGLTRPVRFPGLTLPVGPGRNGTDIGSVEVQQACPPFVQSTPTTPCPPSGGGGGPTTATPAQTGQRAAALKKCKKKKSKQKRKKCKKKANKLPV